MKEENQTSELQPNQSTAVVACSPEVAAQLYSRLEYYFEYAPVIYGMSRAAYEATMEGKLTRQALEDYRKETGARDTYAPAAGTSSDKSHGV